jgi:hypothetical protein
MANDVMIDIESLDTSPNCVILSIGAVLFNPKGAGITEKISLKPLIEEQTEKFNRVIDDSTIQWWSTQSESARNEAMGDEGRIPFRDCMEALYKFCWNRRAVWSHGAPFDVVAMESAFRNLDMKIPWPYYTVRDTRTLFEITGVRLGDGGHKTTHKAVEDAERQAIVVQKAYGILIAAGVTPQ